MVIHAHILSWNEEKILPFTLDHYSKFCDKIFIHDNMSSDGSDEIYKKYENVTVLKWDSNNQINDVNYLIIKNNAYKQYSRDADWVIVCDCDEILYHENLLDKLKEYKGRGIDIPKIDGHDMVSEEFPEYDGRLITEIIKTGSITYEPMCKSIIFNPKKEIRFGFGAHNITCQDCIKGNEPELKLLHYKFLGLSYIKDRYQMLEDRLSQFNKDNGLGGHYKQKVANEYMEYLLKTKYNVI